MFCEECVRRINEKDVALFPEQVGPRVLLLESVDYFGTSEYFSRRKKKRIFRSKTSMVRLTGRALYTFIVCK